MLRFQKVERVSYVRAVFSFFFTWCGTLPAFSVPSYSDFKIFVTSNCGSHLCCFRDRCTRHFCLCACLLSAFSWRWAGEPKPRVPLIGLSVLYLSSHHSPWSRGVLLKHCSGSYRALLPHQDVLSLLLLSVAQLFITANVDISMKARN